VADPITPRSRLALLQALGLRSLSRHYGRTLLTLLGVAAGVGVTIGIDLAVRSSIASFSRTARAVAGPAQLRVHRRPLALPESMLVALRPFESRAVLHPTLEAPARAHTADGYPFTILGLDLIGDPRFTETSDADAAAGRARRRGTAPSVADPLTEVRDLFDPGTLFVPSTLAGRIGARDSLDVIVGTRAYRFGVRRVLTSGPITSAAVTVAFMDVAPFQERFDRRGELDWVDVQPNRGVEPEVLEAEIRTALRVDPSGAWRDVRVEQPEERALQMERMLASYRRNLRALSLISLVVGMLLAYNALLSSVLQRRSELALLRALGAPREVVALILGAEGFLVGVLGGAFGVVLGRALSEGALRLVSRTIGELYARSAPAPVELGAGHWVLGIALGLGSAVVASIGPFREGLRVRPLEFLREEHPGRPERLVHGRRVVVAVLAAMLAGYLIVNPEGYGAGLRGYVGAAAALLAGILLASPAFVLALQALRRPLARVWAPAGRLAYATALASRRRLAVSVAALLLAYGIVWGMASLVESFRVTVESWADSTLRADIWVTPRSRAGSPAEGTMPPGWRARIAALPEVEEVDAFRLREVTLGDELIWLGAGESRVLVRRGFLPLADGSDPRPVMAGLAGGRRVLISEPLARRRQLKAGSRLLLPTPFGNRAYEVAAVYRDYSSDRGYVIMDRATYLEDFRDSLVTTYALYLKPGVARDAGVLAAQRAFPDELVRVTDTATIRNEVRRVMRNTFAVTDALEGVAVVVALLSVLGALAALVLERTREIGVLRAIGASRRQVMQALLLEGALVAGVGVLLGALTGALLSGVLVHVLNRESFGWTLTLSVPWGRVLLVAGLLFGAALLATVPPARRAAAVPPREAMSRG
jgi:putative ABC transport system permease protein